jgi:hypothetical protein
MRTMRLDSKKIMSGLALAAFALLGVGCDLDVPDLNNPSLDDLENNPTQEGVAAACAGLLIGNRLGVGAANGFIVQMGILGREAYNFDGADPRFVSELLEGNLSPASPFGGAFWLGPYSNLRLADITQRAKENVTPAFDATQLAAISGWVKTMRALDLYRVVATRDVIGGVIDTDHPIEEVAPLVSKEEVLDEMAGLLDEAVTDLTNGGEAFPFALPAGFGGFATPATFIRFNRALRARTAAYRATTTAGEVDPDQYQVALDALDASFIDDTVDRFLVDRFDDDIGVFYDFGIGVGDTQNSVINVNIFAHKSTKDDVVEGDARYPQKINELPADQGGTRRMLTSNLKFKFYQSPKGSIPIIRNEELILLRAEARWFTGDTAGAVADLNLIRVASAGLDALAATPASDEEFVDELLYNRRYSLLLEGHRLVDMRRFDRIEELPLDFTPETCPMGSPNCGPHVRNIRWPLPAPECDARPGQAPCAMGSR